MSRCELTFDLLTLNFYRTSGVMRYFKLCTSKKERKKKREKNQSINQSVNQLIKEIAVTTCLPLQRKHKKMYTF